MSVILQIKCLLENSQTLCATLVVLLSTLSGCAVYNSPDRSYFNSNAIYGAPTSLSAQITDAECQTLNPPPGDEKSDVRVSLYSVDNAHLTVVVAQDLRGTTQGRATCVVDFQTEVAKSLSAPAPDENSTSAIDTHAAIVSSQELLQTYLSQSQTAK